MDAEEDRLLDRCVVLEMDVDEDNGFWLNVADDVCSDVEIWLFVVDEGVGLTGSLRTGSLRGPLEVNTTDTERGIKFVLDTDTVEDGEERLPVELGLRDWGRDGGDGMSVTGSVEVIGSETIRS